MFAAERSRFQVSQQVNRDETVGNLIWWFKLPCGDSDEGRVSQSLGGVGAARATGKAESPAASVSGS